MTTSSAAKRAAVLAFLRSYRRAHGYSPSVREVATGAGLSSTSVATYHLLFLQKMGLIEWTPKIARSIVLKEAP